MSIQQQFSRYSYYFLFLLKDRSISIVAILSLVNLLFISIAFAKDEKYSQHLFEPIIPDQIKIILSPNSLKKYQKILDQVTKSNEKVIRLNLKKLKAKLFFQKDGKLKKVDASVRISGDLKDHINKKRGIATLKVQLKNDHIGHIVNFRLPLEHTQRGKYDVMWSSLMETLGFPVPYGKLVDVDFNGRKYSAVFEESPEKESWKGGHFESHPSLRWTKDNYGRLVSGIKISIIV